MKKLLSGLMVVSFLAMAGAQGAFAIAVRSAPPASGGGRIMHPLYGGYDWVYKSDTAEQVICTGKCLLAGLITNTGASTVTLTIRNTSVANGTGPQVLPLLKYDPQTGVARNALVLPLVLSQGISAQLSSVANAEAVTVVYIDLDP